MLPLFKSDFSIGKSILRLNKKSIEDNPESSIFKILLENNINKLVLVEDSMIGFMEAYKNCLDLKIDLLFGIKISVSENLNKDSSHKVIIFSRNKSGCKLLNKIYSFSQVEGEGFINYKNLKKYWSDDLILAVPFYDSFIFNNIMFFSECIPDFSFCNPLFFLESNSLPFDSIVKNKVFDFCQANDFEVLKSKSIYYNKKEDFSAFQTYKCLCNRSAYSKSITLESPNLDHCSSNEFSFESYLENESS